MTAEDAEPVLNLLNNFFCENLRGLLVFENVHEASSGTGCCRKRVFCGAMFVPPGEFARVVHVSLAHTTNTLFLFLEPSDAQYRCSVLFILAAVGSHWTTWCTMCRMPVYLLDYAANIENYITHETEPVDDSRI